MARSSRLQSDLVESLESQIENLRHELKGLRKLAAKRGREAYEDASETTGELYEDLAQRVSDLMPHMRKGARMVERRARENPGATAALGLVALGLIAALVMRRSD